MAAIGGAGAERPPPEVDSDEEDFEAPPIDDIEASRKEARRILMSQYKSNIVLGVSDWKPTASHASEFTQHDLSNAVTSNAMGESLKKDQRMAHYEFGRDEPSYYTTAGAAFAPGRKGQKASLSELQKAEVRNVHFVLGNEPTTYVSEARSRFTGDPVKGEGAKPGVAKGLQVTHYVLGEDSCDWRKTSDDFAEAKIDTKTAETNRNNIKTMKLRLRTSNIEFSPHTEFHSEMREVMPDPRDAAAAYAADPAFATAKARMKVTSVSLGADPVPYQTNYMVATGEKTHKVTRRFKPKNLGRAPRAPGHH